MSNSAQPLPHWGRWAHRRLLWLLVGLIAVAGIAVALDRTVFLGEADRRLGAQGCPEPRSGAGLGIDPRRAALRATGRPELHGHGRLRGQGKEDADARRRQLPDRQHDQEFTAVLVMRLVAQGKIALDATISTYLPGLLPDGTAITIRELLSHTSGLSDFANDPRFLAPYEHGRLGFAWTPEQMVGFAASRPLEFAPGTKFSYSNTNYVVLALLAQSVGGESYERQLARYIFRPLKLDHTSLPSSTTTLPDVHGYARAGAGAGLRRRHRSRALVDTAAMNPAAAWAVGGIRATAQDEADFLRGLFSGKLLPQAQVAAMQDTSASGGAYGLGLMPTGGYEYEWRSYTKTINTTCGRAWGHGGAFPGYYQLPISSPDGSRQAVLLVNADETLLSQAQYKQVYAILATAYCRGVAS